MLSSAKAKVVGYRSVRRITGRRQLVLAALFPLLSAFGPCGSTPPPDAATPTATTPTVSEGPADASAPPAVDAGAPPVELKIATWNLEWLNAKDDTGNVKRKPEDYDRLKGYADKLNADVVAFQEVDGDAAAARVFDAARYAIHLTSESDIQRTGFAYKKTLSVTKNPDYNELDVGSVRAGADMTVEFGGTKLRLMSVHLKSGCFDDPLTSTKDACKKLVLQLPKLEAWIDARAGEGVAFGVLGDFNRRLFKRPDEPFWLEIDDSTPPEADLASPTDGQTGQCWDQEFPQLIDHLVLSKSGTALVKAGSFTQHVYDAADKPKKGVLSDHCPLSVVLVSSGGGATPTDAGTPPPSDAGGPVTDAGTPTVDADSGDAGADAKIKGNIGSGGKKLYHLPNCPNYANVKIEPEKGERMFVTEAEAQAAGWGKSPDCP